jgi:hypothetical protein
MFSATKSSCPSLMRKEAHERLREGRHEIFSSLD